MGDASSALISVGAAVDARKLHTCTSCGYRATDDRMFNPSRKFTDGKLVVFCRRCAKGAVKEGITLYRLSATLKMDAERKAREFGRRSIFAAIAKKQREAEEQTKERAGSANVSSRSLLSPTNKPDAISGGHAKA